MSKLYYNYNFLNLFFYFIYSHLKYFLKNYYYYNLFSFRKLLEVNVQML